MNTQTVEAQVFFRHTSDETTELARAVIPLDEHIRAVAHQAERQKMRRLLNGENFTLADATKVRTMLRRAANYARNHVSDYFPIMQPQLLINIETLEQALEEYWYYFQLQRKHTVPTE